MTAQSPKPSAHDVMAGNYCPSAADTAANRLPGFGMTVNIINGGLRRVSMKWQRAKANNGRRVQSTSS
jgi:hypothetical protein